MDLQLKEKVILVTGAAKGIGRGIAELLAKEGAIPVIIGRNTEDNMAVVEAIKAKGGKAGEVTAELTRPEDCKRTIDEVIRQFGRIEAIVNNAGVNDGVGLEKGGYEAFVESLHRNLIHYYLIVYHALPELKKSKGAIVNISSKTADTGQGNTSAYAASNGGRNALTREWAVDLAKYSIRVNAVVVAECYTPLYDTWIKTQPNPEQKIRDITSKIPFQQRFTTVEEIANVTAFLLSEAASHTTGQIIYADGGYVHLDRAMQSV